MNQKQDYIAVFDSGVGGISVLKELIKLMPEENYLYFGDSANAPYGNRPTEHVRRLTMQAADMLIRRGIKAFVIACNTATAAPLMQLKLKPNQLICCIMRGNKVIIPRGADRMQVGDSVIVVTLDKGLHDIRDILAR